jgi:hypothetical protein
MHDIDIRIAAIASRQLGVFTLSQARECGATRAMIRSRLQTGRWGRLQPKVFRLAGTPPTQEQALLGACLAGGSGALLSYAAAGWLYGYPRVELEREISVPDGRIVTVRNTIVHRPAALSNADRASVRGLPATTPVRTIIDLAPRLDTDTLDAAVNHALARRLATLPAFDRRLEALGTAGRPGMVELRRVLDAQFVGPRRPNEFERKLLRLLERLPGPRPVPQHKLVLPNGSERFLDAAYPDERFGIEAESYEYHSSPRQWAAGLERIVEITALGWRILPVSWFRLVESPAWVLTHVAAARGLSVMESGR